MVNGIGTRLRDLIKSRLAQRRMVVLTETFAERREKDWNSEYLIKTRRGE